MQKFKDFMLSIQHLLAMFGATVLVPMLTGFDISVALFSAGLGTLIFHKCTKNKVPVFLGSSFAFIPGVIAVKEFHGGDISYASGAIAVAGLVYVLISYIIKKVGREKFVSYISPIVIAPIIISIGVNLLPTAFSMASNNFLLSFSTLFIAIFLMFVPKGSIKQFSIILAIGIGLILSIVLKEFDFTLIQNAKALALPAFHLPKISMYALLTIVPVVIAVSMEHIGDISANSKVVGQNFLKDPGLDRTFLGDGLATVMAGLIGGPANTTYGENTGVLAATKNYNPKILRTTAVIAIGLSFLGKISAVIQSIPVSVMGGISLLLFSMISLIGFKTIKNEKIELNLSNVLQMIIIFTIAVSGKYISLYITDSVSLSGISLAAVIGILMNTVITKLKK